MDTLIASKNPAQCCCNCGSAGISLIYLFRPLGYMLGRGTTESALKSISRFLGNHHTFPTVAVLIYMSSNSILVFPFLHMLNSI